MILPPVFLAMLRLPEVGVEAHPQVFEKQPASQPINAPLFQQYIALHAQQQLPLRLRALSGAFLEPDVQLAADAKSGTTENPSILGEAQTAAAAPAAAAIRMARRRVTTTSSSSLTFADCDGRRFGSPLTAAPLDSSRGIHPQSRTSDDRLYLSYTSYTCLRVLLARSGDSSGRWQR